MRGGEGRERYEEARNPRVDSHPMCEILKNTLIAELIGGGGNTDVCPGRQTRWRRHSGKAAG